MPAAGAAPAGAAVVPAVGVGAGGAPALARSAAAAAGVWPAGAVDPRPLCPAAGACAAMPDAVVNTSATAVGRTEVRLIAYSALRRRAGAAGAAGCGLRLDQHERRRRAVGGDRIAPVAPLSFRLDVHAADVDDSRELADPLEERARGCDTCPRAGDRSATRRASACVATACGVKPRIVRFDCVAIAWMRRSRSATSFSSAAPARSRSSCASRSATWRAELRQPARGRETALDVGCESSSSCACALRDALLRGLGVVVPEDAGAGERQRDERAELAVPRQLAEAEVHGHYARSRYRRRCRGLQPARARAAAAPGRGAAPSAWAPAAPSP